MKFSKENFSKNAPSGIIRALGNHVDTLDGMTVDFSADEENGIIESYMHEGEDYYLYPVLSEWCEEEWRMLRKFWTRFFDDQEYIRLKLGLALILIIIGMMLDGRM